MFNVEDIIISTDLCQLNRAGMDGPSLSPTVTPADSGGCQPLSGPLTGMTIKDILEKVDLANNGSFPSNDVATPPNGAVQDKKPVFLQPNST